MKFGLWVNKSRRDLLELAREAEVSEQAMCYWALGVRTPQSRPAYQIWKLTDGEVDIYDWLDVEPPVGPLPEAKPLKTWLVENRKTQGWMGSQIGVSGVGVSLWVRGIRRPSLRNVWKMQEVTDGVVRLESWFMDPVEPQMPPRPPEDSDPWEKLRYWLTSNDISQAELARMVEVSEGTVSYWFKKVRKPRNPARDKLTEITQGYVTWS